MLLAIDKGWDKAQVDELIDKDPTDIDNGVPLDKHIPVHVTYFTVWADEGGELNTREDVYGHEKRISLALQGKWDAIDKGEDHLAAVEPDDAPKPSYRSRKRQPRRARLWRRLVRRRLVGAGHACQPGQQRRRHLPPRLRLLGEICCDRRSASVGAHTRRAAAQAAPAPKFPLQAADYASFPQGPPAGCLRRIVR